MNTWEGVGKEEGKGELEIFGSSLLRSPSLLSLFQAYSKSLVAMERSTMSSDDLEDDQQGKEAGSALVDLETKRREGRKEEETRGELTLGASSRCFFSAGVDMFLKVVVEMKVGLGRVVERKRLRSMQRLRSKGRESLSEGVGDSTNRRG